MGAEGVSFLIAAVLLLLTAVEIGAIVWVRTTGLLDKQPAMSVYLTDCLNLPVNMDYS